MFSKACTIAAQYTYPVFVSYYYFDKTVESSLGAFVIINEDGWIITAAHIIESAMRGQQHATEIQKYNEAVAYIENQNNIDEKEKKRRINKLGSNAKWIRKFSFWWGADKHLIREWFFLKENDIAIGKIENFDPAFIKSYPVFKEPENLQHGTSLCKLGFPFYEAKATYNVENNAFSFDASVFPVPRFPLEGIFTRDIAGGKSADKKYDIKFIETSSPGLRGQSGGPTFDKDGRIWAIQSQTRHMPLGFSPKLKMGDKDVIENQFLNVGWGAHVATILKFLDDHGVKYQKG
jgi:hypothetical protein